MNKKNSFIITNTMEKIKKGDGRESDWLIVIINREVKEKVSLKSDKKINKETLWEESNSRLGEQQMQKSSVR